MKDLAERTQAEELWLWRRSKGLKASTAAARFGIGRSAYWRAEAGRRGVAKGPWRPVRDPPAGLLCALARRRSGMTAWEVARALGVSRVTLLAWERASDGRLGRFWARKGYAFPVYICFTEG